MDTEMKNVVRFPDNLPLKTAAAEWLVKLDCGPLSAEDRKRLQNWLAQSPEHKDVLLKMATLWGELDVVKVLAELFPLPEDSRGQTVQPAHVRASTRPVKAWIAAAVVCFVSLGFVVSQNAQWLRGDFVSMPENLYTTRIGEHSEIELPDGSRMILNTQSKARVSFSAEERAVYLEQGEGYFQVKKNPGTPFVVYAGNGMITALGTAFSVRIGESNAVDVTLAEGVVEVVADGTATVGGEPRYPQPVDKEKSSIAILDKKGETVSYKQSIDALIVVPEDKLERKLAWKSGKWLFKGETLAEVMAEASRYTERDIQITDPSIERLQVAGYFDLGDLGPLLEGIEAGLGVTVTHRDEGVIELSARRGSHSGIR